MFPDQLPQLDAFEILTRLGGGGMAEVFLGRARGDTGFEKLVAIKQLRPHMANNSSYINMLLDEARVAANLSHINIGQTYDLKRIDDSYYIILEFIQGVSLHEINSFYLDTSAPAPQPMVAYIASSLCAGLAYAHDKTGPQGRPLKIIHRDVSPDNVMVSYEGEVKLIDFGVAKGAPRQQETIGAQIKGKPIYMSPEQATGSPLDHRADIYAAGLVLYEMLTRENPLHESETHLQIQVAARPRIAPPSSVVSTIDPVLVQICMKALAVDPEQRYASAGLMEQELGAYLQQHPYYRQELATWMQEVFAEELERLQQVISPASDRKGPRAAHQLLNTPETDLVSVPAGYQAPLKVVQLEDPEPSPSTDVSTHVNTAVTITAATETTVYDQTNVMDRPQLPTIPKAEPPQQATIRRPPAPEAEPPQQATVRRDPASVPGESRPWRSRRTTLALVAAGLVTLALALALFLGIQRPDPLESAQQRFLNQSRQDAAAQGQAAPQPEVGPADAAVTLAQPTPDLQPTLAEDHGTTAIKKPARKWRRRKRQRTARAAARLRMTKRTPTQRTPTKRTPTKETPSKEGKGLPFTDL